jgi:hypothetical protein
MTGGLGTFGTSRNPALLNIRTYSSMGFLGTGGKDGQFNILLKRDLGPASNDNIPMWLERA